MLAVVVSTSWVWSRTATRTWYQSEKKCVQTQLSKEKDESSKQF